MIVSCVQTQTDRDMLRVARMCTVRVPSVCVMVQPNLRFLLQFSTITFVLLPVLAHAVGSTKYITNNVCMQNESNDSLCV
jgi:hypothetical protein